MIWDCFWHCETNAIRAISCMVWRFETSVLPSFHQERVGVLILRFSKAQSPGPPIPLSTLQTPPHDVICKTEGQDGVAVSVLVGLFHPLQHASLTRRTLINTNCVQYWSNKADLLRVQMSYNKLVPAFISGACDGTKAKIELGDRSRKPTHPLNRG
jgi:hypothetical protein